jgi:tellurite resistance protein TerC
MFAELGRRGYRLARRIAIGVIGGTVVLCGVIMLVTPGPALVVIPLGLAILAVEFAWARHWLKRLKAGLSKEQLNDFLNKTRKIGVRTPPSSAE